MRQHTCDGIVLPLCVVCTYVSNITQRQMPRPWYCCCHVHTVIAMSAVLERLRPDFQLVDGTAGFFSVSVLF